MRGHEGRAVLSGISVLIKGTPTELPGPFCPVRHPELGLLASRTAKRKFLFSANCPVCRVLLLRELPDTDYLLVKNLKDFFKICVCKIYLHG